MELANDLYNYDRLHLQQSGRSFEIRNKIIKTVIQNDMITLYKTLCSKYNWDFDDEVAGSMSKNITAEIAAIETKMIEYETSAGDTEIVDLLFQKARYFIKIGQWTDAETTYDTILKKEKLSTGKKIDALMDKARIAMFELDTSKLKGLISDAKKLVDIGGDWDRRNRLKVYEAHYLLATREVKPAAKLLMESVATFTAEELCSYKTFMTYALLTSIITLNRNEFKKSVISVIRDLPQIAPMLDGIYSCKYDTFFESIMTLHESMIADRFLGPITVYLIREYRILAYAQFLEAYKSVMLSTMATSFGVSGEMLDGELSRFISAGRLSAKIDKVGDIIETSRPDRKNAQYQEVIKKGDVLLNQIQKLVRVVDV